MSTHDRLADPALFDLPVVPKPQMTEDEFVRWSFRERVNAEWIDGKLIVMSPIRIEHDQICQWVMRVLSALVEKDDLGSVHGPEVQVRFASVPSRRKPDLLFVAADHADRIGETHIEGPPDLIMEVVPPDSVERDWHDKYFEYQSAGVREYWVIDPLEKRAEVFALSSSGNYERVSEREGWLGSTVVKAFRVKIGWLWPATRKKVRDALAELEGSPS